MQVVRHVAFDVSCALLSLVDLLTWAAWVKNEKCSYSLERLFTESERVNYDFSQRPRVL
jgi:hypothetical protein